MDDCIKLAYIWDTTEIVFQSFPTKTTYKAHIDHSKYIRFKSSVLSESPVFQ